MENKKQLTKDLTNIISVCVGLLQTINSCDDEDLDISTSDTNTTMSVLQQLNRIDILIDIPF